MSNRVGRSPCRNVTPRVVVCVSGIFTATMRPIEVLTSVVIETPVGSAVKVKLTVAFEEEVVRRYRVEADHSCQNLTERLCGQLTSEIEEHLWYNIACLWYRSLGVDYGSSGGSVVRYLPKGWQLVIGEETFSTTYHGLVQPAMVDEEAHSGGLYMISGSVLERTTFCCAKAGRSRPRIKHIRERESGMIGGERSVYETHT